MSNLRIGQILRFIVLVFLQIGLFNRIHLGGYAIPLLYIYYIIKMPLDTNRSAVLILSASMGLCIDIFNYTLGLNMLSCTVIGFLRYFLLKLFSPRDVFEFCIPSIHSFGKTLFFQYSSIVILLHQIVLFTTESLSTSSLSNLFLNIAGSSILTTAIIYIFENINLGNSKK